MKVTQLQSLRFARTDKKNVEILDKERREIDKKFSFHMIKGTFFKQSLFDLTEFLCVNFPLAKLQSLKTRKSEMIYTKNIKSTIVLPKI